MPHQPSLLACTLAIFVAASANAHHSGAMFDHANSKTLTGTVKAFQWTNPHCWIQIAAGEGGVEWSVEMGAPTELYRTGWRPGTLRAGERITVVVRPMRDGTPGGLFVSATRESGEVIGAQMSPQVTKVTTP